MNINTKFDIGQQVYIINKGEIINKNCPICKGNGIVKAKLLESEEVVECKCLKCNGTGNSHSKNNGNKWSSKKHYTVKETMYVGKTMIKQEGDIVDANYYIIGIEIDEAKNIRYKLKGISLDGKKEKEYHVSLKEDEIFATKEEAEQYCKEFNDMQEFD